MTTFSPFCWYELMTTDAGAATEFYSHVVGWVANKAEIPDNPVDYTLLRIDNEAVAGLMELSDAAGADAAKPGWLGYVLVDDTDASAAKAKALGGSVYMGPMDIPHVGRFAVIGDPHGAAIGLMKWAQPMEAPDIPIMMSQGHTGWHELMAGDLETDFAFYAGLFGWTKAEDMDMGPMGTYRLFGAGGENSIGGMMTKPEQVPAPSWGYYFAVEEIDAAIARVKDKGGQIINGPMEVPGGAWIIQFALVAPPKPS
jgi:predicted enzyme related to lactoylglutathione lyase